MKEKPVNDYTGHHTNAVNESPGQYVSHVDGRQVPVKSVSATEVRDADGSAKVRVAVELFNGAIIEAFAPSEASPAS